MDLKERAVKAENYINIIDAFHLIIEAEKTNVADTAYYLLVSDIHKYINFYDRVDVNEYSMAQKQEDHKKVYLFLREAISTGRFKFLNDESFYNHLYWKKSDFFNYHAIKVLDLPEAKHWLSNNNQVTESQSPDKFGTPAIGQPDAAHYQRACDQYKQQAEQLQAENDALKQRITELEAQQMQNELHQNAINNDEINLPVNDLMLIAALVGMLRNEKRAYTQAKILQTVEDNHQHMTGLSKSRTEKILAAANKAYKSLNNKKMK